MLDLRIGSLFSGIGGLELGLERAGLGRTVWQCELDPWARGVLARHWPGVPCHGDIHSFDPPRGSAEVICAGFPCQPFSAAGSRLGWDDPRALWPQAARVVRKVRPLLIVLENVPGLLGRGLDRVLGDLAALGYDAEWDCITAGALGAPHERDRLFIIAFRRRSLSAYSARLGFPGGGADQARRGPPNEPQGQLRPGPDGRTGQEPLPTSGRGHPEPAVLGAGSARSDLVHARESLVAPGSAWGSGWSAQPALVRGVHGLPGRVDRIRGLGAAVCPPVSEFVGRRVVRMIRAWVPPRREASA